MKKLAFIVGLLSLFFISRTQIEAACEQLESRWSICWSGGACLAGSTAYCCDSPVDCDALKKTAATEAKIEDLCKFAGTGEGKCTDCFGKGEAWTAIGCIPTSPSGFIQKFLGLGIGIAGGIAFLLILFSGFQMLTSVGNPEKLNAGKELLSAAISGLVLIVFSIFLLRLIGVNILSLPGFE